MLYDLPTFAKSVQSQIDRKTTVEQFFRIVEDEGSKELSFAPSDLDRWACSRPIDPITKKKNSPVQYIMAGYESGAPVVHLLDFKIDWEKNTINPVRVPIQSCQGQQVNCKPQVFGFFWGYLSLCDPQIDAYKEAIAKFSFMCDVIQEKAHTLDEASDMARIIIGIEAEVYPDDVNFPITVVTLPAQGRERVKKYNTPFLPQNFHGPKNGAPSEEQHPR